MAISRINALIFVVYFHKVSLVSLSPPLPNLLHPELHLGTDHSLVFGQLSSGSEDGD